MKDGELVIMGPRNIVWFKGLELLTYYVEEFCQFGSYLRVAAPREQGPDIKRLGALSGLEGLYIPEEVGVCVIDKEAVPLGLKVNVPTFFDELICDPFHPPPLFRSSFPPIDPSALLDQLPDAVIDPWAISGLLPDHNKGEK